MDHPVAIGTHDGKIRESSFHWPVHIGERSKLGLNIRLVTRNRWWAALDRKGRLKLLSASLRGLLKMEGKYLCGPLRRTGVTVFHVHWKLFSRMRFERR
jgi:hypothetical protein